MREVAASEFAALPLGDAEVSSIAWINDATDLRLVLRLPSQDRDTVFVFRWVMRLRIDLDFRDRGGRPLTWDVKRTPLEKGRWLVCFDFGGAPDGMIEFECDGVQVEDSSEGAVQKGA